MHRAILTAALFLAVPSSVAVAQDAEPGESGATDQQVEFDAAVEAGKRAFETGDYKGAITAFEEANGLRPTPSLLYNIGRAYDANGDLDNAERYYDRFVNAPGVSQKARADAVARLKTIRDIKRMKEEEAEQQVADTVSPAPQPQPEPQPEPAPAAPPEARGSASPLAWVFIGVGGAALAGGVVTGLVSQSAYDDLEVLGYPDGVAPSDAQTANTKRETAKSMRVSSVTLLASGAALTVAGIVAYFATKPSPERAAWRFTPTTDGTSAGVSLHGIW